MRVGGTSGWHGLASLNTTQDTGPFAAMVLVFAALVGCRGDAQEASATGPAPIPEAAATKMATVSGSARAKVSASSRLPLPPVPVASHAYQHGPWASCSDGFRTSGHPQRDVTRLAYLCGPYQGMRRFGRTFLGRVGPEEDETFEARLHKGQCGRVFAVADEGLASFRVTVSAPSGALLGRGHADTGFVIVNAQGAFCVRETGTFRVTVAAQRGAGQIAAELWVLPAR